MYICLIGKHNYLYFQIGYDSETELDNSSTKSGNMTSKGATLPYGETSIDPSTSELLSESRRQEMLGAALGRRAIVSLERHLEVEKPETKFDKGVSYIG